MRGEDFPRPNKEDWLSPSSDRAYSGTASLAADSDESKSSRVGPYPEIEEEGEQLPLSSYPDSGSDLSTATDSETSLSRDESIAVDSEKTMKLFFRQPESAEHLEDGDEST